MFFVSSTVDKVFFVAILIKWNHLNESSLCVL